MSTINISYVTSDKFVPITMTSIISCLENNKNQKLKFFVFSDGVKQDNRLKIEEVFKKYEYADYQFIELEEQINKLIETGIVMHRDQTYTTYSRILVANMVPDNVKRLIHIDSDTLVVGSLKDVNDIDLNGKPMGMVTDFINSGYKRLIGLGKHDLYYNAGNIVFDVEKWNANKCTERIIEIINTRKEKFKLVEQDILNEYFQKEIAEIPFSYNYQTSTMIFEFSEIRKIYNMDASFSYSLDSYNEIKNNPIIFHFAGIMFSRPFYDDNIHPMKEKYLEYYSMLPWKESFEKIKLPIYYRIQVILYRNNWRKALVFYTWVLQRLFVIKNKIM